MTSRTRMLFLRLAVGLAVLVVGCSPARAPSEPARHSVGPLPDGTYTSCVDAPTPLPHDDPALEARLPTTVGGRLLFRWSSVGWCLIDLNYPGDQFEQAASAIDEAGIDVTELRLAVAGRGDVEHDPPYFVWILPKASGQDAQDLAILLLSAAMGARDPAQFPTDPGWERATIGGKEVLAGSAQLIGQTEHQRGKPYIYETDSDLFALITDEEEWAADALRQLP